MENYKLMDFITRLEIEKRRVVLHESKRAISNNYNKAIEEFLNNLSPSDVGMEKIGPYHVHFEGFTDMRIQSAQDRTYLPPEDPRHLERYEDIYDEVLRDFIQRENGNFPIDSGLTGDEEYPIYYAVFQVDDVLTENKIHYPKQINPGDLDRMVQIIHRDERDFSKGDLTDRIYWFNSYVLTELELSIINLNEYYVDENLVKDYIDYIKDSPNTMPPIVFDPYNQSVIDGIHRANAYARLGYSFIPAYIGQEKSDSFAKKENYKYIDEASPDTIEGSFTSDLIKSKEWLVKVLSKLLANKKPNNIYILGSWYGNMGLFIEKAGINYRNLVLVEPDEEVAAKSKKLLSNIDKHGKLIILRQNLEDVVYEKDSVIVNTSCNETGPLFLLNIPDNTLCLFQARDNVENVLIKTDSLEEFDELFPLSKTILLSKRELEDPETKYHRFMKVGRK